MNSTWNKLVRSLRMHAAPRRLTAMLSILTAFTLLFSFAGSAQPALAVDALPPATAPTRPTVNGLFYGDRDFEIYGKWHLTGLYSDTRLYRFIDPPNTQPLGKRRMFVAMVVDGNLNDNAFDAGRTSYMESAGWPDEVKVHTAKALMDSEKAQFAVEICGQDVITWTQGYARQFDGNDEIGLPHGSDFIRGGWRSNETITNGSGELTAPEGYTSSSSIVWNLNNYATNYTGPYSPTNPASPPQFDMGVNCTTFPCDTAFWKSPFVLGASDTVTTTGGWPETITTTTPISFSIPYQWEWAMVYEWSVLVPELMPEGEPCTDDDILISTGSVHHSPSKTGISDDPTPVTLTALAASTSAALLPIAGLLVGVSGIIVAPRRRRRRDE